MTGLGRSHYDLMKVENHMLFVCIFSLVDVDVQVQQVHLNHILEIRVVPVTVNTLKDSMQNTLSHQMSP